MYLWLKYYSVEEKDRNKGKFSYLTCRQSFLFILHNKTAMECHVPDLTTKHGLISLMAVGNVLELGHALDKRFYDNTLSKASMEEYDAARFNYRLLRKIFSQRYSVMLNDLLVLPAAIFRRSLMTFAGALVTYKHRGYDESTDGRDCTPQIFHREISKIISMNFPEHAWEFDLATKNPSRIHWEERSMDIRLRLPSDRMSELSQLSQDDSDSDSDHDSDSGDDEKETFAQGSSFAPTRKRQGSGEFL